MQYPFIAWQESGVWTAHSPGVPGVYGLGRTEAAAKADLAEALKLLCEYLAEQGTRCPRPSAIRTGRVSVPVR